MEKDRYDGLWKMFTGSEAVQKEIMEGKPSTDDKDLEQYHQTAKVIAEKEKEIRAPFLPPTKLIKVHETVSTPTDIQVPSDVLEYFIRKAGHRVIAHHCGCRQISGCNDYPQDLGCMFFGEPAKALPSEFARAASVEEALAHARRWREAGLVPHLGYVPYDAALMGIDSADRFMSVCGCCPCCCISRFVQYQRMPGVEVRISDACTGCGTCAENCPSHRIEIVEEKACIDEGCIACGWCVNTCPEGAIEVTVVDPDYVRNTIDWISQKVDVS